MSTQLQPQPCARCGNLSDSFVSIDPGMRLSLQEAGQAGPIQESVCSSCYEQLTSSVSQGMKLRMEQTMREKNKMMVWKNRVHLIKNARALMNQKAYSEAAVQYEKYLRVLEVVYNLKKGELSPAVFNNSTRSKELTVIASVYWDLVRIYDTSPRYGDRMQRSATKLAEFLQFSPIYPDIIKKAEQFARSAKNQNVMRQFLRATKSKRGPCFVATAVYADEPYALELTLLRNFRDRHLR
ncbi:MAG: CFI-box-CTERM domain-containing protein, partial [Bdellovibrionales bacterium]